jgi:hypothetical protein
MIRMGKKRCRAFLEEALGIPWREIERAARLRKPIEAEGVEIVLDAYEQPSTIKEAAEQSRGTER